ncbi:hypothetical protein [Streptomyces xiaopingdaonensis]|uniref:hypothetical protein n=1 Tax=Streptomyces xiaopingdaonensis TaxID=1565415 RepID=UPI0002F9EBFE|nr:hypothetical protein [Streptomyces xiaopingdaonensis]
MSSAEQQPTPRSFVAASVALGTMDEAVRAARTPPEDRPAEAEAAGTASSEQALAALLLLRRLRDELAGWEPALIEVARAAGASWAELAHPLGVASRQAAERRYLRVRPGRPGDTGEQRVQDTRKRRAGDRAVAAWARGNAADLRQLAARIATLTGLPDEASGPLVRALSADDPTHLLAPLSEARPYVAPRDSALTHRLDTLARQADELRGATGEQDGPA